MQFGLYVRSLRPSSLLQVLIGVAAIVCLGARANAAPQYSAPVNVSVNVWYDTNSAGLPDYRKMHVSAAFSSTPANSEGIYGGTLTLHVGAYTVSGTIPGTPNPYTCSISISDFYTVDPSNSVWPIYATATFSFWNQGGGNSGDGSYSKSSSVTNPGPGTNTLGTASYTFSGGPWTYDGNPHAISITPIPANAGWRASPDTGTQTDAGGYTITVTPTNPDFQGSGSYSWTIRQASMVAPTSTASSASPGVAWSPPVWNINTPAPAGGGYAWVVAGRTSWGDPGWIPSITDAGTTQTFYVGVFAPSDNYTGITDSHLPGKVLAVSPGYSVAVGKANQTISFGNPGAQTYGAPFSVSASATSGLGVNFAIISGPATLSGSTVTPTGSGSVTIRASQGGNGQYNAAPDVDQTITINKANQSAVIVAAAPTSITTAQTSSLSASGGSGTGAYVYQVVNGPGSISGSTLAPSGTGTVYVQAMRQGDSNFNASAWSSAVGITVSPATIPVSFTFSPTTFTYDGASHSPTITANPAGATYSIVGTSSAVAANSYTFTVTATGSYSGSAVCNWSIRRPGFLSYSGTTDFGNAYRDSQAGTPTSTTQTFTLSNTGEQPLTVNSLSLSGNFTVAASPSFPVVLSGGGSTSVTLRFTPGTTTGTNTGTCVVNTTANSPSFALTGTGLAPKVSVRWH